MITKLFYEILNFKLFPTKKTPVNKIRDLINALKPIATDRKLIRLGNSSDGGYIVPDDLKSITALFSPGVADCADFELDCLSRGMNLHVADYSVQKPPLEGYDYNFLKKFIGSVTNSNFISFEDWINGSQEGANSEFLLQMDIEGYEYESILSLPNHHLNQFRIIVVEFHGLHNLWSLPFFKIANACFRKLLQNHSCIHIHPNNARGVVAIGDIEIPKHMEFTFYRKDRFLEVDEKLFFPNPLDCDNVNAKSIVLPKCWQR